MKHYFILALLCLTLTTLGQNYDARLSGAEILTPKAPDKPKINGPRLSGARPGKPFVHRIPTTGVRPIKFQVKNLPKSLILNPETGIITGRTPDKPGDYKLQIRAKNKAGEDSFEFTLVVGDMLALTPPMGWNHWYTHYLNISDSIIRNAADEMVKSGMADVGYQYISIDDCWMQMSPSVLEDRLTNGQEFRKNRLRLMDQKSKVGQVRDEKGNILPARDFPDMKALTDHIHGYGLKAGIYSSPGPLTCQSFVGSLNFEAQDAKQYADWGFDLLKYDWCSYGKIHWEKFVNDPQSGAKYPYKLMGNLLKQQDRDIVLNICQYGNHDVWKWGSEVGGHSWRIGGDLGWEMQKSGLYAAAKKTLEIREYNKPGAWNDLDYLIMGMWTPPQDMGGKMVKKALTPNQHYTYFSLWAMMATPLFFSGDMGSVDDFIHGILCNTEMIAVNQDPLGQCAEAIRITDEEWILKKTMEDGSLVYGFFNLSGNEDRIIKMNARDLVNLKARDLWRQKDIGTVNEADSFNVQVGPLGCAVIHFSDKK
jgi:alpha-galactosidase